MKLICLKMLTGALLLVATAASAGSWSFKSIASGAPEPMYPATNLLYKLTPYLYTNNNAAASVSGVGNLINGVIPINTTSGTVQIKNNSAIYWAFDAENGVKLHSIRIATSCGDTTRAKIKVAKICVKTTTSNDEWVMLENSAGGDSLTAKSHLGTFSNSDGSLLAEGVTALMIDFGASQQSSGVYYSEIEAATVCEGDLKAKLTLNYYDALGTLVTSPALDENSMINKDTVVEITALPIEGVEFEQWFGNVPEENKYDNPLTITMDNYKSLTAIFAAPWEWASNSMTDGYWQLTTKTEGGKLTITAFKRLIAGVPILDLRKPVNGTDLPLGKSTVTWQKDTSLKILRFADSMTYYGGEFCFRECTSLAEVVLPANLTSTAKNGFYKCSALRTVTPLLPDSVATINTQSFLGNPLSGKLVVNNPSVKSLTSAFQECSGLKEMDFSKSGLTTINEFCFRKCSSVTNIYFPATLNILAKDCLYQCGALRSVYLESKPATIHFGALEGVPSTMRLVIYKDDIDWMDHLAMCETNTTTPFVAWSNLSASVQSKYTFTDTRTCKPYGTVKLGSHCSTVYIATRSRGIPGLLMLVR